MGFLDCHFQEFSFLWAKDRRTGRWTDGLAVQAKYFHKLLTEHRSNLSCFRDLSNTCGFAEWQNRKNERFDKEI